MVGDGVKVVTVRTLKEDGQINTDDGQNLKVDGQNDKADGQNLTVDGDEGPWREVYGA